MNPEKRKILAHIFTLVVLCLFLFFWRIGDLNFFGTEGHRALPAQTMLDTHEWWVTRLNGEIFLSKPPLTYWLIALFSMPQGKVTETTARLPSAVSATILVLLIYWFASGQEESKAGLLCAMVVLTTGLLFQKAIVAEIDMNLTLWVTASLLLIYRALTREQGSFVYTLGAYAFLSLAFLSKGPPALVFFGSTLIAFLIWEGRLKFLWSSPNIFSLLVLALIILSWGVVVIGKVGWPRLVGGGASEFASRATSLTSFHVSDIFFYPLGILGGFFPWSLIVPFAFLPSYYRGLSLNRKSLQRFLYCGIGPNLVLFSTVAVKDNRYLAPVYPLLGLIAGMLWYDLIRHALSTKQEDVIKGLVRVVFGVSVCGIVGFLVMRKFLDFPNFPLSTVLLLGLAGIVSIGFLLSQKGYYKEIFACLVLIFLFFKLVFVFDFVPYKTNQEDSVKKIAHALNSHIEPGKVVYTLSFSKPCIFFYMQNPVIRTRDFSVVYNKSLEGLLTYCILEDEEIRKLRDRYCFDPKFLHDFMYRGKRVLLVVFDPGEVKAQRGLQPE